MQAIPSPSMFATLEEKMELMPNESITMLAQKGTVPTNVASKTIDVPKGVNPVPLAAQMFRGVDMLSGVPAHEQTLKGRIFEMEVENKKDFES